MSQSVILKIIQFVKKKKPVDDSPVEQCPPWTVIFGIWFKWWFFHCHCHPRLFFVCEDWNQSRCEQWVSAAVCNLDVIDDTIWHNWKNLNLTRKSLNLQLMNILCSPLSGSKCSLVAAPQMTQRSFFWLLGNKAPGPFVSWVVGFVIIPIYKEFVAAGYGMSWLSFKNLHRSINLNIFHGSMISRSNKEHLAE